VSAERDPGIEGHTIVSLWLADETIRKRPGFTTVRLLESWLDRSANGGRNGNRGD